MNVFTKISNHGISIFFDDNPKKLIPSSTVNQKLPKKYYVYGHYDSKNIPFYIGKGTGNRAWVTNKRHPLWNRYVNNHLNGKCKVIILEDNLSSEDAEELESQWIAQESETLVNWVNCGRKIDFKAIDKFHKLRNKNRKLFKKAKDLEKSDLKKSINLYLKAMEKIWEYASIQSEQGLVGKLIDEERLEIGISGDLQILDRLTLCLIKNNQNQDAFETTTKYFLQYKSDKTLSMASRIEKRIKKANKFSDNIKVANIMP